ncbi:MAG: PadR family transcriptional regulator [Candidatus Eisenbacteria bacterium]
MKHITRRRADREVRLGTWRVIILHRAASRAIWGNALHKELTGRGYKIFMSTFHEVLHGMERNGLLKSRVVTEGPRREFRITAKGRRHLAELCQELTSAYEEVVRGNKPPAVRAPVRDRDAGEDGIANIVAVLQRGERERIRMRAALEQIHTVSADMLGVTI